MSILPTYVSLHYVHTWHLQRPEEGDRSPGTGVTGSCESQCSAGNKPGSPSRAASALNLCVISSPIYYPNNNISSI